MSAAAESSAAECIRQRLPSDFAASVGVILGSGLGQLGEALQDAVAVPYDEIAGFVRSTAPGHRGRLLAGRLAGRPVICLQGRFHRYEGYAFSDIIFPIRVLRLLGVRTLLVTNAAGGINTAYAVGDLMLIADHINLMGGNPLVGPNAAAFGERFFDMGTTYTPALRALAKACAAEQGLCLQEGVYLAVTGPSYETPAEIRAFRTLGADAVGMSTVPEVIAARHCGMDILGVSLITNLAAGVTDAILTGEEVIEAGRRSASVMERLLTGIIGKV
jgi:purine-nucleoside phosphorylase